MIKFEDTEVFGWEHAIRGMRNPKNSWAKSDSHACDILNELSIENYNVRCAGCKNEFAGRPDCHIVGPNDHNLMMQLAKGGPVHAKYRRMIVVYVDITAPLYWWKEFDTYKVGTVANSCSTMHKIHAKEFTLDDFSCEHLLQSASTIQLELYSALACAPVHDGKPQWTPMMHLLSTIAALNHYRQKYLETKDKKYWWQMIQLLPSSYNQKRTVMLNYEVLVNIYHSRDGHKLDEWRIGFIDWIKSLPYSELITECAREEPNNIQYDVFKSRNISNDKIEHLVDITCSWDDPDFSGFRIYSIAPGFTKDDLTTYEKKLLERSEKIQKLKKE